MSSRGQRSAPTDEQLADMARFIARVCLEVERGLRPPDHLARLMNPATAPGSNRPPGIGRFDAGPVLAGHVGSAHVSRTSDRTVFASVVTRTEGDRWGALAFRLDAHEGRWHLAALRRLLPSTHHLARQRIEEIRSGQDRYRLAVDDRRLATAALEATTRRLADLQPGAADFEATRVLVVQWKAKVAELDRELAAWQSQLDARQHLEGMARR